MAVIGRAEGLDDLDGLEAMLREYLIWDLNQLSALSGVAVDPEVYVGLTLKEIDVYFPPRGRLLLARDPSELVGMAFLKPIRDDTCEIKRIYVRPDQRCKGLGKIMLGRLIDEAREIGYARILLDSATYMSGAHALYRSMGFQDIAFYPEGETDKAFEPFMVYMERTL